VGTNTTRLGARPLDTDIRENVCFVGYDPQRAIGYLIQLSRWCLDSAIWREQVQVFMPDGTSLLHRGWGKQEDEEFASALLKVVCEEPERKWHISYRGPVRRTTPQELSSGPLLERTQELLDVSISFESDYLAWDINNETSDHKWVHSVSEQPGKITGRLETRSGTIEFNSYGYRNYSRGTRTLSAVFDHCWANGVFASGKAFGISHARMKTAGQSATVAMNRAVIWNDGRLHVARCTALPLIGEQQHALEKSPTHFVLDLESELGPMRIEAQSAASIPHSTTREGEWLDGIVTDNSETYLLAYEQPVLLVCNGESGCGHIELSRRLRNQ
jgi:hypothetical protein